MSNVNVSTRKRILDAACRLFADNGYDNVSLRQIADKAEVRHGSLKYHFTDKKTLYTNVFRIVYDLEHALTYDVLLQQEPLIFDTPAGKAYAIQRIVFDYFHRHVFIPEEWKLRLINRELLEPSSVFRPHVEKKLETENGKMKEFYYALCPEGTETDALYWSQLPCAQALYYFLTLEFLKRQHDGAFIEEFNKTIVRQTAKLMIAFFDLPVPQILE